MEDFKFKLTKRDSKWKPGDKQCHPYPDNEMVELDPDDYPSKAMYPFIISAVVPRPIGFICSQSKEGIINLAPYSYFNIMSHDPPVVCIGTCSSPPTEKRQSYMKDSQHNIMNTREFTLNMISEWFVDAANHTSGSFDPDVDELSLAGFTPVPSKKVKPPRLQESILHFECKLRDTHEIKNKEEKITSTIVIAEVVHIHVNKHVTGKSPSGNLVVDPAKYAPVSRGGGVMYFRTIEGYEIPRPK